MESQGLTFAQFKKIKWEFQFPRFICDLIEYISGLQIVEQWKDLRSVQEEQEKEKHVASLVK